MIISDLSVKRPVFAAVINLILVIFGIVAFTLLPLREYPNINPPVVSVNTSYPGASAAIVESKITRMLEDRISGIAGIKNVTSRSRAGRSSISIAFELNRDIDAASNDVRERISRALRFLPEQANPPEVFKTDSDGDVIMWFMLYSTAMNTLELTDYANRYLVDRFSVVDGVANVYIGGGQKYAMRILLDRKAMAARSVTANDIEKVLRAENVELPAGNIESTDRDFTVRVQRAYQTSEAFSKLVIKQGDDGYLVRLSEIANVELGPENDETTFRGNGKDMVGIGIVKQSTANTLEVIRLAKEEFRKIQSTLPEGTEVRESMDRSIFIQGAIDEVYRTLFIAMGMVLIIIFIFLGDIRATLIPAVTVPISLIASFMVLMSLGYTINLLTLLALVLAIGLVVDDSIVVLENIHRRIEKGEPPLLAAFNGAREVAFAVIATTLVLIAVFVPIVFLQGNIGRLFTEFAVAISAAVAFSSLAALSLTPMMCSKLLKPIKNTKGISHFAEQHFSKIERFYKKSLSAGLNYSWIAVLIVLTVSIIAIKVFTKLPQEFTPKEDRGGFFVIMQAAEGASFESNTKNITKIEKVLLPFYNSGEFKKVIVRTPGFGNSSGIGVVELTDWTSRKRTTWEVLDDVTKELQKIPDVRVFSMMSRGLGGRGLGRPVQFVLGGNSYEELAQWRDVIISEASNNPGLVRIDSDYKETLPHLMVEIDLNRAADLGVSVSNIGRTLESMLGQRRVTTFVDRGEEYNVVLEGIESDFQSPQDMNNIYVRSDRSGELIPLSNLIKVVEKADSSQLNRYNRRRSITISANLADNYSIAEALTYLNQIVREQLPATSTVDYKGQSLAFIESGTSMLFTFALALSIVYLVLAAQFESFIHPLVIIITVPLGLAGALLGLHFFGMALNVYSQIGLVMLIGLAAKNGILIIEFTNQLRDAGYEFKEAILTAATQRLRPIVMTAATTIMSSIPLILSFGPGAESRIVIGTVIFGGVLFGTILTLFVVPAIYSIIAKNTSSPKMLESQLLKLQADKQIN
ncbi:MAG: efflux RND transporter permease subunit [Gammaproteobacteria bacterium]|nr:efflux RND transporter permease subunit [Gammaproteobacteria bacterium]